MARTAHSHADAATIETAERLLAQGDAARAAGMLLPLESRYRGSSEFLLLLGRAESDVGRLSSAEERLRAALRLDGGDPRLHYRLAVILRRAGRLSEALESVDRALATGPADPLAVSVRADLLDMSGRHDDALAALEPALEKGALHLSVAVAFARLSPRFERQGEAIAAVEGALARGPVAPANRAVALFALALLLDGAGEFDRAFEAARAGHALRGGGFDAGAHGRQIDAAIAGWNPTAISALPAAKARGPRPVLIVGMPRSGTSLVEQILASHPAVFGAGERAELTRIAHELSGRPAVASPLLTDPSPLRRQTVERCARRYLDVLRGAGGDAPVVTDKNPTNFLHLGLAQSLLPEVRVIHCVRDPRDTGLSCWFHDFAGVMSFVHDLGDIASYWRDYQRLMAHWTAVLGVPILDVAYEDLVADQAAHTRRMLDFLGLPWDDACLRFDRTERITLTDSNRQVRRGLYASSVGRWKNYERHLRPLLAGIGEVPERTA